MRKAKNWRGIQAGLRESWPEKKPIRESKAWYPAVCKRDTMRPTDASWNWGGGGRKAGNAG